MNYPYANGTIKAIESKTLDRNKLFVLSKYEKKDFVKYLQALNYGGNQDNVEGLIEEELLKFKSLINSITPEKRETDLFFLVNDAQNLKIIYKAKLYDISKLSLLKNNASIDTNILIEAICNNNYEGVNKDTKRLIDVINKKTEGLIDAKKISCIIDNEVYQYALKTSKNSFIRKYLTLRIDITNVKSLIRAKNLKWSLDDYLNMFISGGTIERELFENIFDSEKEVIVRSLQKYYKEKISNILSKENNELEINFERLVIEEMSLYKDDPFNIGPIIYYYLLKQAEALNIRILYSKSKVELSDLI